MAEVSRVHDVMRDALILTYSAVLLTYYLLTYYLLTCRLRSAPPTGGCG